MADRRSYRLVLALVGTWCVLVSLPAFLAATGLEDVSEFMYWFFSRICHQEESRSLFLLGHPLGVCARCSMIYFGFFIGMTPAGFREIRASERFISGFILALLPMFLDVVLDTLGMHQSTLVSRVVTGLIFGIGSGVFLTPLLVEGMRQSFAKVTEGSSEVR